MAGSQLPAEIKNILDKEVHSIKEQYNPLGIVLVGSYTNGIPGKHSDLDVHIVVEDQDWRERGNYLVDDHEIEYFINPVKQIYKYMEDESALRPHTAHMFAHGLILYERDPVIADLISTAKTTLENFPEVSETSMELFKYGLDDGRKDLLNQKDNQQGLAYQLTSARLLQVILEAFFSIHQTFMPKTTLLMDRLQELDPEFAQLLDQVISSNYSYDNYDQLITYVETSILDGKRKDIWSLRGPLRL